jgi:Ala-tRNA(Pro) deacylase
VKQGSVTPLALFNDKEAHKLRGVLIDSRMIEEPSHKLLFHPLSNDFTTEITAAELETFLKACGHDVNFLDFSNVTSIKRFEQKEAIK